MAQRWGRDNRGALLRVLGGAGDAATRIENRSGEPAANPYLYIASQVAAGLDGLRRRLPPPPATEAAYAALAPGEAHLPASLGEALQRLEADAALQPLLGPELIDLFLHVKRAELARHDAAEDKAEWQRREYFSRL